MLYNLVMAKDFDQLLSLVTNDEIATAWCEYCSHTGDDRTTSWAVEVFISEEIFRRPELYRSLLLKLVEHADDSVLGVVGAWPLENFVCEDEAVLVWLEQQCEVNPRFRTALSNVWVADVLSETSLRRLRSSRRGRRRR